MKEVPKRVIFIMVFSLKFFDWKIYQLLCVFQPILQQNNYRIIISVNQLTVQKLQLAMGP